MTIEQYNHKVPQREYLIISSVTDFRNNLSETEPNKPHEPDKEETSRLTKI